MIVMNQGGFWVYEEEDTGKVYPLGPAAPAPAPAVAHPGLPVEVHNSTPVDGEAAMRAVRAICGG